MSAESMSKPALSLAQALRENRMKEFMAQYKGVQADGELFDRLVKKASGAQSPKPQRKASRTSR
jgi:hypothetical protein